MIETALRYPATLASCSVMLVLGLFFAATGALSPGEVPAYATSNRQLTGMVLMLIVLPAYIAATSILAQRRSLQFVEQLRPALRDPDILAEAAKSVQDALRKSWLWGGLAGLAMAPFNTQMLEAIRNSPVPSIDISISLGQYILWLSVGLAVGIRVVVARAFSRLGEFVEIDLFDLDPLEPLTRSRLLDVVVIAGGLALTALQSLDAEFRWENYRFAALVMVPMATLMLLWPLRSLHLRIREQKRHHLKHVDELIAEAAGPRTSEETQRFEMLLAHRDRTRDQRTWPLDTPLLSRFALYVIIPPIAWVGAALVENLVDRFAGG